MDSIENDEDEDYPRAGIDQDGQLAFLVLMVGIFFGFTMWGGFFIISLIISAWLTLTER